MRDRTGGSAPSDFDWGIRAGGGGGAGAPPLLTVDVSAAPDDGNAPENNDVTTITEPSPDPAEGADDLPPPSVSVAASSSVTIPGEQSSAITLHTVDGTPARFEIVQAPPTDQLLVTAATRALEKWSRPASIR